MSLTKQKVEASHPNEESKRYPTWEDFVQAKVDRTNELISRMDQNTLRELIESKKQSESEKQS